MYIYYNENNEVKMISEKKLKAPNFKYVKKELKKEEMKNLQDINYDKKIIKNELKLIK